MSALVFASCMVVTPAAAEVSSWMYVGGGASQIHTQQADTNYGLLQLESGLGASAASWLVLGGIVRTWTHFGAGTDLVLAQRSASSGFAQGDWGMALDLGGYQRWWGPDATGFQGTLSVGGPWGLTLALTGAYDTQKTTSVGLTFGLDWARATAHRQSGQNWWPNTVLPLRTER